MGEIFIGVFVALALTIIIFAWWPSILTGHQKDKRCNHAVMIWMIKEEKMESFVGPIIQTKDSAIIINPGTGPVDGTTVENAQENIAKLIEDCGFSEDDVKVVRVSEWDEGGRFGFELYLDDYMTQVDMPGLPLEQVRYIDSETQNIWHFPRLYVDGSSWVWKYAIDCTRDQLKGIYDEDD